MRTGQICLYLNASGYTWMENLIFVDGMISSITEKRFHNLYLLQYREVSVYSYLAHHLY